MRTYAIITRRVRGRVLIVRIEIVVVVIVVNVV